MRNCGLRWAISQRWRCLERNARCVPVASTVIRLRLRSLGDFNLTDGCSCLSCRAGESVLRDSVGLVAQHAVLVKLAVEGFTIQSQGSVSADGVDDVQDVAALKHSLTLHALYALCGGNEGVGFAIPINLAKWFSGQLTKDGIVHRARLGVMVQTLNAELAKHFGLNGRKGVLVADVTSGSPAT